METQIKAMREDRDLSQQEIADMIGISQRKYRYLETRVQQWMDELLARLAVFYQTSDYLPGLTDEPAPYPRRKRQPSLCMGIPRLGA